MIIGREENDRYKCREVKIAVHLRRCPLVGDGRGGTILVEGVYESIGRWRIFSRRGCLLYFSLGVRGQRLAPGKDTEMS